jgi:hypothetical protein
MELRAVDPPRPKGDAAGVQVKANNKPSKLDQAKASNAGRPGYYYLTFSRTFGNEDETITGQ